MDKCLFFNSEKNITALLIKYFEYIMPITMSIFVDKQEWSYAFKEI